MSDAPDALVREFLVESYENLDRLDRALVDLEKDPHDAENLASIFRTVHTIKALTLGYRDFNWLARDPDLLSLRQHPRYRAIESRIRKLKVQIP